MITKKETYSQRNVMNSRIILFLFSISRKYPLFTEFGDKGFLLLSKSSLPVKRGIICPSNNERFFPNYLILIVSQRKSRMMIKGNELLFLFCYNGFFR